MNRLYEPVSSHEALSRTLSTLSAREQISLLLHASGPLSKRDKAEILGATGLNLLKDRLLPILLHIVVKRVLAGVLWGILSIIAALLVLFILAAIEQINARAVTPVIVASVSYLAGFLIFSIIEFCRDIAQFFKTTRPHAERDALLAQVQALDYPTKVALLRSLSVTVSTKVPGETLLESLLSSLAFLIIGGILIVVIVGLTSVLPVIATTPLLIFTAGLCFVLGFFVQHQVQRALSVRTAQRRRVRSAHT